MPPLSPEEEALLQSLEAEEALAVEAESSFGSQFVGGLAKVPGAIVDGISTMAEGVVGFGNRYANNMTRFGPISGMGKTIFDQAAETEPSSIIPMGAGAIASGLEVGGGLLGGPVGYAGGVIAGAGVQVGGDWLNEALGAPPSEGSAAERFGKYVGTGAILGGVAPAARLGSKAVGAVGRGINSFDSVAQERMNNIARAGQPGAVTASFGSTNNLADRVLIEKAITPGPSGFTPESIFTKSSPTQNGALGPPIPGLSMFEEATKGVDASSLHPVTPQVSAGIGEAIAMRVTVKERLIGKVDAAVGRPTIDLNAVFSAPDPTTGRPYMETLGQAVQDGKRFVEGTENAQAMQGAINSLADNLTQEVPGFPGARSPRPLTGAETLTYVRLLDDIIKEMDGYNLKALDASDLAKAAEIARVTKGHKAVRRALNSTLNEYVGGDVIKSLNGEISAGIVHKTLLDRTSLRTLIADDPLTQAKSAGVSVGQTSVGGTLANIKEAITPWNEARLRSQANQKQVLGSGNLAIQRAKTLVQYQREGIPKIPRSWALAKKDANMLGIIASAAFRQGIINSPEEFQQMPDAVQESIAQNVGMNDPGLFERAANGFMSLFNGQFTNPAEERVQAAQITRSAGNDVSTRYKLLEPLYRNGTHVPTPEQEEFPPLEESYETPAFDMNSLDTIMQAGGSGLEPENESLVPSNPSTYDTMLSVFNGSQNLIDPEEGGF